MRMFYDGRVVKGRVFNVHSCSGDSTISYLKYGFIIYYANDERILYFIIYAPTADTHLSSQCSGDWL